MREMTCIVCPMGCRLELVFNQKDEVIEVKGNRCRRGEDYAKKEYSNPERLVTTTVKIEGAIHRRLPVVTSQPVPASKILEVIEAKKQVIVKAPVHKDDVVLQNVCGLNVDLIASRSMKVTKGEEYDYNRCKQNG